ncbi:MAG: aspartate kinase [Planctomycetes bacterium]|nr:aspartate kinase [Planctomycetota bacterium]
MIGAVIVMKFGGTSVGDAATIGRVVEIVRQEVRRRPVVVVSAHAGVTDMLLALTRSAPAGEADTGQIAERHRTILRDLQLPADLLDGLLGELDDLARGLRLVGEATPRAVDAILGFGERCSARTVAAALAAAGIEATAADAFALGLRTDSSFGRARPLPDDGRIARAVAALPGVPVITGFVAADERGNLTTLGRNGSDYSAALFAAALDAQQIQVWKDVDGVHTADPRLVDGARPIRRMSYGEACELASFGSKVLHPAAMIPAMQRGITIAVRNTGDPQAPGTSIEAEPGARPAVRAIAHRDAVSVVTITSQRLLPQHTFLARVFAALDDEGGDADFVAAAEGAVAVVLAKAPDAALQQRLAALGQVQVADGCAVVGVVGEAAALRSNGAATVLQTLAEADVEVRCAGLGALGGTFAVVVTRTELQRALAALHQRFFAEALQP